MSKTICIFEKGSCRGDEFKNEIKVNLNLLNECIALINEGEDVEDVLEQDKFDAINYFTLYNLLCEEEFIQLINKMNHNEIQSGSVWLEESIVGVAFTMKDAKVAFADFDEEY